MGKLIPIALRYFCLRFVSFGVLTIFCSADMPCTSTVKHECSVCLLLDAYVPYVNHKLWTFCMLPIKHGRYVCLTSGNNVDGNLPEDWELDGNAGKFSVEMRL